MIFVLFVRETIIIIMNVQAHHRELIRIVNDEYVTGMRWSDIS